MPIGISLSGQLLTRQYSTSMCVATILFNQAEKLMRFEPVLETSYDKIGEEETTPHNKRESKYEFRYI